MVLVAVIDWFSRYVLAWQLSNTLDSFFYLAALQQALQYRTPAESISLDLLFFSNQHEAQ